MPGDLREGGRDRWCRRRRGTTRRASLSARPFGDRVAAGRRHRAAGDAQRDPAAVRDAGAAAPAGAGTRRAQRRDLGRHRPRSGRPGQGGRAVTTLDPDAPPLWRSLLYVPASAERFVAKAAGRGADGVILDLEDSIPPDGKVAARAALATRSEEHTSELQSLMRISYAVFCLKKKKRNI